jgi:methylenetetrahydrofolate reductase (NADPH)
MIAGNLDRSYRRMISGGRFPYGVEVVTSRGVPAPASGGDAAAVARDLLADPRVGWVSVTDNPGGAAMLPPDWLAGILPEHRARLVLHLTCKDMNRNALEAAAWRYAAEGFDNVLALSGDYPTGGFQGRATPVFDLDSVSLVALLRSMNEGLRVPGRRGATETLSPTRFFIGCAVSPFKRREAELIPQYFKLVRKIAAGADWVITQLGYDMRKFHEVKLMLASRGLDVPVIGNAYLLTKTVARMFHDGQLAGCVVSDELLADVEKYSAGPDKGRGFFQELAAKQLAVFRGLGFAGGYLGGMAKPETFGRTIDMAERFGPDDWRDFIKEIRYAVPGEFFLFEHDPATGLSEPTRINPEYLRALKRPPRSREVTLGYRISRAAHRWLFSRNEGLFGLMQKLYARWDGKPGWLGRAAYWLERRAKFVGYECQDCGDCSLPECAYLCPMIACSKHLRNGPCGGSSDGRCELGDKDCFWARVYERMRHFGEAGTMLDRPTVFYHGELRHTSSWANRFLERDHLAGVADGPEAAQPSEAAGSAEGAPPAARPPSGGPAPEKASGDASSDRSKRGSLCP